MSQPRPRFLDQTWNPVFLPPAAVLGLALGLFVCGYWLSPALPPTSKQLLALTALAAAGGTAVYFVLLIWAWPRLRALPAMARALLPVTSLLLGVVLLFGSTTQWQQPGHYISFLLPSHRLEVRASGQEATPGLAMAWFNTSLGDVSYDTLHVRGWKRIGDELVLQNPNDNELEWTGKPGDMVQIIWHLTGDVRLQLTWDGQTESMHSAPGKLPYSRAFAIPWYASREFVLALGALILGSLSLAAMLFLWERRAELLPEARAALSWPGGRLDRVDFIVLAGGAILALLLRLPNLGGQYPAVDEYFHLIAARQIIEGAALGSVYERGLWLVTMPVALSLRLFGYQFWAARLPGLLFNVLALVPLYLLTRRLNRSIALLSVALYATSPWIVTFARIAREYAYYPFYFYWIILGMVVFIGAIPQGFVLVRDWKQVFTRKTLLTGLALLLPPIFAFYGDRLSTFRTILIAYLVMGVFLLARFDFRDRSNWPFLGVLGIGLVTTAIIWYERQKSKIVPVPTFNFVPVSYFIPDPQQQWYYGRLVTLLLAALICAACLSYLLRRTNFIPLFLFALFGAYIVSFAFLSKTFYHTRHLLTTELWYGIVLAIGLYMLWKVIAAAVPRRGAYGNVALAAVLGLSIVNVPQLLTPITSTNPDNPISEDYLHDMSQVHAYMLDHAEPHDVLISTVYGLYSSWREQPKFEANYRITTETPRDQIFGLIEQNHSGWIVIDQIRLSMSTLGPREFAGNPDVEYIGLFGDQNVWYWQHASGGLGSSMAAGKGQ